MKSLLAISWAMPPMLFPRSVQVARLLGQMCRRGWRVKVVCCRPEAAGEGVTLDHTLYAEPVEGLELVRAAPAPDAPRPDPLTLSWLAPAVEEAQELLRRENFAAMVSFGQPWVDHLVGLELRKRFDLPWAAHFSDPWVDNPYYAGVPPKELKAWAKQEKEMVKRADLILFTNPAAQALVMGKYPRRWGRKAASLPHCFDRDLMPARSDNARGEGPLRLAYTGDFYGQRTPLGLLKALAHLNAGRSLEGGLVVECWGGCPPEHQKAAQEMGLEKVVNFHPRVPYLESLAKAERADVLLVIDAPSAASGPFLPSKLVDYFMLAKPVLGLTPRQGAAAQALDEMGCPVVEPDAVRDIAAEIARLMDDPARGRGKCRPDYAQAVEFYDKAQVAERFERLLSGIMGGADHRVAS